MHSFVCFLWSIPYPYPRVRCKLCVHALVDSDPKTLVMSFVSSIWLRDDPATVPTKTKTNRAHDANDSAAPDPNAAKKAVEKAKQAAKKVKHERSDPNSKAGMKKETLLKVTASKFDDFPTWYREVGGQHQPTMQEGGDENKDRIIGRAS